MQNQTVNSIQAIAEQREPTEEETQSLPAMIADDGGEWDRIPISQQQVDGLKEKKLIYYCAHCTQTAIVSGWNGDGKKNTYAAREYHTAQALCDVADPKSYLDQIIKESNL